MLAVDVWVSTTEAEDDVNSDSVDATSVSDVKMVDSSTGVDDTSKYLVDEE